MDPPYSPNSGEGDAPDQSESHHDDQTSMNIEGVQPSLDNRHIINPLQVLLEQRRVSMEQSDQSHGLQVVTDRQRNYKMRGDLYVHDNHSGQPGVMGSAKDDDSVGSEENRIEIPLHAAHENLCDYILVKPDQRWGITQDNINKTNGEDVGAGVNDVQVQGRNNNHVHIDTTPDSSIQVEVVVQKVAHNNSGDVIRGNGVVRIDPPSHDVSHRTKETSHSSFHRNSSESISAAFRQQAVQHHNSANYDKIQKSMRLQQPDPPENFDCNEIELGHSPSITHRESVPLVTSNTASSTVAFRQRTVQQHNNSDDADFQEGTRLQQLDPPECLRQEPVPLMTSCEASSRSLTTSLQSSRDSLNISICLSSMNKIPCMKKINHPTTWRLSALIVFFACFYIVTDFLDLQSVYLDNKQLSYSQLSSRLTKAQERINQTLDREYGNYASLLWQSIGFSSNSIHRLRRRMKFRILYAGTLREKYPDEDVIVNFTWVTAGDGAAAGYGNL
jgi:hypothetical protein